MPGTYRSLWQTLAIVAGACGIFCLGLRDTVLLVRRSFCDDQRRHIAAPGGQFEVLVVDHACAFPAGNDEFAVTAYLVTPGTSLEAKFFEVGGQSDPVFDWLDARHLQVSVSNNAPIVRSLRVVEDIAITYRITKDGGRGVTLYSPR